MGYRWPSTRVKRPFPGKLQKKTSEKGFAGPLGPGVKKARKRVENDYFSRVFFGFSARCRLVFDFFWGYVDPGAESPRQTLFRLFSEFSREKAFDSCRWPTISQALIWREALGEKMLKRCGKVWRKVWNKCGKVCVWGPGLLIVGSTLCGTSGDDPDSLVMWAWIRSGWQSAAIANSHHHGTFANPSLRNTGACTGHDDVITACRQLPLRTAAFFLECAVHTKRDTWPSAHMCPWWEPKKVWKSAETILPFTLDDKRTFGGGSVRGGVSGAGGGRSVGQGVGSEGVAFVSCGLCLGCFWCFWGILPLGAPRLHS